MQDTLFEKLKQPVRWIRSWMAVYKNGYPAKKLRVIAVTGTDGKTTTCSIIYEILKASGKNVGMITTVGIKYCLKSKIENLKSKEGVEIEIQNGLHVTTPDAAVVQKLFRQFVDAGVEYVVVEVTSHRLAQLKTVGYNVEIAVITNISREHLDYHGTMENYVKAKAKLFRGVKYAVLNEDDLEFENFKFKIRNDMSPLAMNSNYKFGILNYQKTKLKDINPSLGGEYNRYNIGAAVAVASILKIQEIITKDVIKNFAGVPGRREEVKNNLGIRMIVDFAHTPNGLEKLLRSYKTDMSYKSRLILVFGCTGERDPGKRPIMGQVAEKYADKIIVTADDPRTESLKDIYDSIIANCQLPIAKFSREDDRDNAIFIAVKMAKKGDTVIAAGMGHEKTMLVGEKEIERSDVEAFNKAALSR